MESRPRAQLSCRNDALMKMFASAIMWRPPCHEVPQTLGRIRSWIVAKKVDKLAHVKLIGAEGWTSSTNRADRMADNPKIGLEYLYISVLPEGVDRSPPRRHYLERIGFVDHPMATYMLSK